MGAGLNCSRGIQRVEGQAWLKVQYFALLFFIVDLFLSSIFLFFIILLNLLIGITLFFLFLWMTGRGKSGVSIISLQAMTFNESYFQSKSGFQIIFTGYGFHLKSGFKNCMPSQYMGLILYLDSQKYCLHPRNLKYCLITCSPKNWLGTKLIKYE